MRATKIKIQDLSIPFLINSDNERHWPMRLICESMGLSWHAQAAKLQPPRYSPTEHDVAVQGEPLQKRMLCLSQSEFEFWLKSLSSRKVSPAARRRLDQLRTHFFGESAPMAGSAPPTATAPAVLKRILNWRAQQAEPGNRKAMLKEIADQFSAKNGFSIAEAQEHQLRGAVASLSTIIYQHDRSKTPSQMPVSQRVDAIIKSIVDARPQRHHLLDSDFAALLCSIELEGQQRTGIHHEQP
ncbi:TPA: phage antirepressor N-terminal domain-containing protein [Pseudomonas aeruginosa]